MDDIHEIFYKDIVYYEKIQKHNRYQIILLN